MPLLWLIRFSVKKRMIS